MIFTRTQQGVQSVELYGSSSIDWARAETPCLKTTGGMGTFFYSV